MEKQMFCFQCEQTAGGKGCMGRAGVCGKSAAVAGLQDELTGALIGLGTGTAMLLVSGDARCAAAMGICGAGVQLFGRLPRPVLRMEILIPRRIPGNC